MNVLISVRHPLPIETEQFNLWNPSIQYRMLEILQDMQPYIYMTLSAKLLGLNLHCGRLHPADTYTPESQHLALMSERNVEL